MCWCAMFTAARLRADGSEFERVDDLRPAACHSCAVGWCPYAADLDRAGVRLDRVGQSSRLVGRIGTAPTAPPDRPAEAVFAQPSAGGRVTQARRNSIPRQRLAALTWDKQHPVARTRSSSVRLSPHSWGCRTPLSVA
jgi:hypothetical protein